MEGIDYELSFADNLLDPRRYKNFLGYNAEEVHHQLMYNSRDRNKVILLGKSKMKTIINNLTKDVYEIRTVVLPLSCTRHKLEFEGIHYKFVLRHMDLSPEIPICSHFWTSDHSQNYVTVNDH